MPRVDSFYPCIGRSDRAFAATLRRIDARQRKAAEAEERQRRTNQKPPVAALEKAVEQSSAAAVPVGGDKDRAGSDSEEAECVSWWETLWPIADESSDAFSASSVRPGAVADTSGPVAEPSVRQLRDLFETIRHDIDAFAFKALNARMRY